MPPTGRASGVPGRVGSVPAPGSSGLWGGGCRACHFRVRLSCGGIFDEGFSLQENVFEGRQNVFEGRQNAFETRQNVFETRQSVRKEVASVVDIFANTPKLLLDASEMLFGQVNQVNEGAKIEKLKKGVPR